LRSVLGRADQTACEYRTGHEVTLWPLELTHAEYTGYVGDLGELRLPAPTRARAALRLKLRTTAGLKFNELRLDELTLFLRGSDELAHADLRADDGAGGGDRGASRDATGAVAARRHRSPRAPVGFEDDEALLAYGPRSFQGYRLLHEYFAFPARFLFAKLTGLAAALRRCADTEIEVMVLTDQHDRSLDGVVSADNLALNCTPAVNLFPRRADRIQLTDTTNELSPGAGSDPSDGLRGLFRPRRHRVRVQLGHKAALSPIFRLE
jgi:type VI secretion system protein ImpG